MQIEYKLDGEGVGEEVCGYIESCVGEVEGVDVDADFVRNGEVPGCVARVALENTCQHVGSALAPNNGNHNQG